MTTIQENRILEALAKASNIGLVEEPCTVMGCHVVLRNLRPEEYQAVSAETEGMLDAEFLFAYQMGHLCRSIIEVGELDLRTVDYVETEVPDPTNPGSTKRVSLERHDWLRKTVLATWGREALSTLYRKFADVLQKADDQSVDGVQFVVPDESAEDKLRRTVLELKALEEDLPDELVAKVLEEAGYMHKATAKELEAANARLSQVAYEQAQAAQQAAPVAPTASLAQAAPTQVAPTETPHDIMRRRTPLTSQVGQDVVPAQHVEGVPMAPHQVVDVPPEIRARSQKYAELEESAMPMPTHQQKGLPERPLVVPEITRQQDKLNPKEIMSALDRPPMAGINPRFKPTQR